MARHEIAEMYKMLHVGAPIYVRNGETARVVAFCEPSDTVGALVIDSLQARKKGLGTKRLAALYNGRYFASAPPRLVHKAGTIVDWRIESGRKKLIPRQQVPATILLPEITKTLQEDN